MGYFTIFRIERFRKQYFFCRLIRGNGERRRYLNLCSINRKELEPFEDEPSYQKQRPAYGQSQSSDDRFLDGFSRRRPGQYFGRDSGYNKNRFGDGGNNRNRFSDRGRDGFMSSKYDASSMGLNLRQPQWSSIRLEETKKNFYEESESVAARSDEEVEKFLRDNSVTVTGNGAPKPIFRFDEACFPGK